MSALVLPENPPKTRESSILSRPFNRIVSGDAKSVLEELLPDSVDLSFWSPPYYVGKSYEKDLTFAGWQDLISSVIKAHTRMLKPAGFMAVNIGDILCFPDSDMPRFQADSVRGKLQSVTREDVKCMKRRFPTANRYELAQRLGCSEQTVQRRLEGNNVRGGKYGAATKVLLTGCMLAE